MGECLSLSQGYCRGCRDNAGGVKRVWLTNEAWIDWANIYINSDDTIGDLPLNTTTFPTARWFVFEPNQYSSSLTETINSSVENGTIFYAEVLSLVFGKLHQAAFNVINELGQSFVTIVVELNNGSFILLSQDGNGAYVSGGSGASGTALGDLNGYTVEFTVNQSQPMNEVSKNADTTVTPAIKKDLYIDLMAVNC